MTSGRWRDLRHAFELDDWPVEGLTSGEFPRLRRVSGRTASAALQIDAARRTASGSTARRRT
jgi:hypothetical protein